MSTASVVVTASVAALGAAGCYFAYKLGLFESVDVRETTLGPVVCLYREYQGPYHQVGKVIVSVKKQAEANLKLAPGERLRGFGCYFDKPSEVPPERCRASLGVMLWGGEAVPVEELQRTAEMISEQTWAKDSGVKAVMLPASRYAFCRLPFHGTLSVILGIWRAYSRLEVAAAAAAGESGAKIYGSLEMYDDAEHRMHVGFPLNVREVLLPFNHHVE